MKRVWYFAKKGCFVKSRMSQNRLCKRCATVGPQKQGAETAFTVELLQCDKGTIK